MIVGKIGQSEAGSRAVASHTAALAGSQAAYRAMFERYGLIEGARFRRDARSRGRLPRLRRPLPAGNRVGICTSSGGAGVWMADACAAAGLEVPVLDDATRARRSTFICPPTPRRRTQSIPPRRACRSSAMPRSRVWSRIASIDGVIVVVTARRSAFLEADLPKLKDLARNRKPVFMWTYTLPSDAQRRDPQRGRLSAVHRRARMRAHAARDGRLPRFARATLRNRQAAPASHPGRAKVTRRSRGEACAERIRRGRCWRPTASAPTMPGKFAHSARRPRPLQDDRPAGGAQGPVRRHPAQDRGRRRRARSRR